MLNIVWTAAFVFAIKGNTKWILEEVLIGKENKNQCLGKLKLFSI